MAVASTRIWLMALGATALATGLLGRFPFGAGPGGLVYVALYGAALVLLAVPLLLGELAVGQSGRRDIVHASGKGLKSSVGWGFALAALALAAFLSVLGGWAARMAFDSFDGAYFDDPDRHLRLITQGTDALAWTLGLLATAVALAWQANRRGLRGPLTALTWIAGLACAAILAYGLLHGSGASRDAALQFAWRDITAPLVVAAAQQALLPAVVGIGLVATLSGHIQDRQLPGKVVPLAIWWLAVPLMLVIGLQALASSLGTALEPGIGLENFAHLSATLGGTAGGVLAGTLFGLLAVSCLIAVVAILEVPSTVLVQRWNWTELHGTLATALTTYLLAVPLALNADLSFDLELLLRSIVGPLGGLSIALGVGWFAPHILNGLQLGPEGPRLERVLRMTLRYVLPAPMAFLLLLGFLEVAVQVFGVDVGPGGLWKLVPQE